MRSFIGKGNISEFEKIMPKSAEKYRYDDHFMEVIFTTPPEFGSETFSYSGVGLSPNLTDQCQTGIRYCPNCQSEGPFISATCVGEGVCFACGEVIVSDNDTSCYSAWSDQRAVQMFYALAANNMIDVDRFINPALSNKYFVV